MYILNRVGEIKQQQSFVPFVAMALFFHGRLKVVPSFLLLVPEPAMPPAAFARAGDVRRPVLTRSVVPANDMYLSDRPAIHLSRMAVARYDSIAWPMCLCRGPR